MTRHDDLRFEPHLALALGGGGALGAAHVGVLQVLLERAIRPSIVVGTSIGSFIGAAYAAEMDPYDLESRIVNLNWGNFGTFSLAPSLGLLNTDGLRDAIQLVVGDALIEDLPIRFGAVASNVNDRKSVLLDNGPLYPAVAASIAVPGIFEPVQISGHRLLDGGIYANLPLEAAFEMGGKHVIGVRLAPEWDGLTAQGTSMKVHELEIRSDVTLISPRLEHRSQWVNKDLPGLVLEGRAAAERALADYEVVYPRPARVIAVSDTTPTPADARNTLPAPADDALGESDLVDYEAAAAPEVTDPRGLAAFFRRR